jgi:uncharacterized protein (TIGR00730 family)
MNQRNSRIVAVFGGSRTPPDSADYAEAYIVGKLLAQRGFVVMNGGYRGTMEASARGAKENGGRTLGMLSSEFGWLAPNPYLDEALTAPDLFARIREMQTRADAFIVLKGSMGTLAELALVWNLAKIDAKHRKPIILLGDAWACVLRVMREQLAVTEEEARLLQMVDKPEEAVGVLDGLLVG